jgi:hypothetical protein
MKTNFENYIKSDFMANKMRDTLGHLQLIKVMESLQLMEPDGKTSERLHLIFSPLRHFESSLKLFLPIRY